MLYKKYQQSRWACTWAIKDTVLKTRLIRA